MDSERVPDNIVKAAKGVLREFGVRDINGREIPHWQFIARELKRERDRASNGTGD